MSDVPGIVVTGASGRMGQMLIRTVVESDRAKLVGVVEREGHDWIGQDIGTAMGGAPLDVTVSDDPLEVIAKAHAVIDFTAPAATVAAAIGPNGDENGQNADESGQNSNEMG